MATPPDAIDRGLEILAAMVREDPAVGAELEASVGEFFGGSPPAGKPGEVLLAARRHLEWFVLERHSPALFGVPVERWLPAWSERAGEALAASADALLDSFGGVFAVGSGVGPESNPESDPRSVPRSDPDWDPYSDPGDGILWLEDLAGFGSYALRAPEVPMRPGDLLVGRLYPLGEGLHAASQAAAVFRDPRLLQALETDLAQVRERRERRVLHLSQRELERMFWGAGRRPVGDPEAGDPALGDPALGDPVAHARRVLQEMGVGEERATAIFAHLASCPWDGSPFAHGAGDALGEVLDGLAFEIRVDLDAARPALTRAWHALSGAPPDVPLPAPPARTRRDARAAVEAFARGRAAGNDLGSLFAELERGLGLEPEGITGDGIPGDGGSDDPQERAPAPDFPGVVGALVEEFLWEVGRERGQAEAERHRGLSALADFGARIGVAEGLDADQLLRFTTFWVHERGTLGGAEDARSLLDSVEAFCAWAQQCHSLPLGHTFGPTLERLRESLPRVAELNRLLGPAPEGDAGELYAVAEDPGGRFAGLLDREGRHHDAAPQAALAARLRPGDRLRGRICDGGELVVFRCYPPEAAGLST